MFSSRAYREDLLSINGKIQAAAGEIQQIQHKVTENEKLADERRRLINDLEANLRMLKLQTTEIQSIEYPQEADVEVMVSPIVSEMIMKESAWENYSNFNLLIS